MRAWREMNAESGARVRSRKKGKQPQRLKPQLFHGGYGTTEVVPRRNRCGKDCRGGRRKIKRAGGDAGGTEVRSWCEVNAESGAMAPLVEMGAELGRAVADGSAVPSITFGHSMPCPY